MIFYKEIPKIIVMIEYINNIMGYQEPNSCQRSCVYIVYATTIYYNIYLRRILYYIPQTI